MSEWRFALDSHRGDGSVTKVVKVKFDFDFIPHRLIVGVGASVYMFRLDGGNSKKSFLLTGVHDIRSWGKCREEIAILIDFDKDATKWHGMIQGQRDSIAVVPTEPPAPITVTPATLFRGEKMRVPITVTPMERCTDCGVPLHNHTKVPFNVLPSQHKSFCKKKFDPAPELQRAASVVVEKVTKQVVVVERVLKYQGERDKVERQLGRSPVHGTINYGGVDVTEVSVVEKKK